MRQGLLRLGAVLRPYQLEALVEGRQKYDSGRARLLFPMATGLGKTVVLAHLPHLFPELAKQGMLVLVHREELVWQAERTIKRFNLHLTIGIEKAQHKAADDANVIVATIQTLSRSSDRLKKLQDKGFGGIVVVDEAHHLNEGRSYDRVLTALGLGSQNHLKKGTHNTSKAPAEAAKRTLPLKFPKLLALFTATPYRGDKQPLVPFFDAMVKERDIRWGITNGYLVDIEAISVETVVDLQGVAVSMGDFAPGKLEDAVNVEARNAAVVRAILDHAGIQSSAIDTANTQNNSEIPENFDKMEATAEFAHGRALVFCAGVAHAHALAETLEKNGVAAKCIHAGTPAEERRTILDGFKTGAVKALTNVGVLTEGFDAPECDTIVMCRPVLSKPLYMQMLGRGTRPLVDVGAAHMSKEDRCALIASSPKPRMKVIDFVDNCKRHKIVTTATTFGLAPTFNWQGTNAKAIFDLLQEAKEVGLVGAELEHATSVEELRVLVRRYRLLGPSKASSSASSADAPICVGDRLRNRSIRLTVAHDPEEDDWGKVSFEAVDEVLERQGRRLEYRCWSRRMVDVDGDPLYANARYELDATVLKVTIGPDAHVRAVEVMRCRLKLKDKI